MTDAASVPAPRVRVPHARPAARVGLVLFAALALGGATSFGQTFLPAEAASLANSVSGWTLPTVLLVLATSRSYAEGAVAGAVSFVALTVGYAVISTLRGFPFDPATWAIIGLLAGPVVGAATHSLRRSSTSTTVGGGVLAGILIGEGAYGLTVIADSTSPVFWWAMIAIGCAFLVAVAALRLRDIRSALVMVSIAVLTSSAFVAAYLGLPVVTVVF